MKVLTYNTLYGGFDGEQRRRYSLLVEAIRDVDPDVLLVQELKGYLAQGGKQALQFERDIGLRGFIGTAPHTGQNTGIFIKSHICPLAFESDSVHFHHAASFLTVSLPNFSKPVTFISVHLSPLGTHVRLAEASFLMNHADAESYTILAGDFNSIAPGDSEPEGLSELPSHFAARYMDESGMADRRTIECLLRFGFVDIGAALNQQHIGTVPAAGLKGTEFVPFRSDYVLATRALVSRFAAYKVVKNSNTDAGSDHYPVLVELA